jgi:hypothetical protein
MTVFGIGAIGFRGLAATPEDTLTEEVAKPQKTQWTVGLAERIYSFTHDSLQQRADYELDDTESWRNGSSDGSGTGLRATATRGDGYLDLLLFYSSYAYKLNTSGGSQKIDTDRRDLHIAWFQPTGSQDFYNWGWQVGIRYVGADKRDRITEKSRSIEWNGGNTWYLLSGGYYGEARPFGKKFKFYGNVAVQFGEVSGLARSGNDTEWDGSFEDTYDNKHAIAYGLDAVLGAAYDLPRNFSIRVDYRREWLYSFAATDTGLVTFPDNQDALFQEAAHAVTAAVEYKF